ncbi:DUF1758 domain-containing protein [Trichonephila clavipes]|nr:DUF1758 domain-containing protein [Trichonephila clavipes]
MQPKPSSLRAQAHQTKFEEKQFKTLNKETATHIGIREAEDWFRPIDLAKECDIYISSRSGSHKEIPITYGYTQDPFKNKSQNFKTKIKENYPQYHERENKNCFICGDSSHCARDCEKRFKPKESNDHIHNKINVNTLKVESEKQNSEECANLQYVNIFVENQPVTALIDSGCQIPVLNSSLIRVQTPSEEIITLSSCFGEKRMVEVKPINISLNQHSPSLSVGTAISPTLTEEFIIHPSVYSEIEKLGHAKSDVLLNEILCKKANGAMKTSSVEFISRSPNPLPMKSKHHRFVLLRRIFQPWQWKRRKKRNRFEQTSRTLQRKISMRSTKDQLVEKDVLMPVKHNVFLWNLPDVEEVPSHDGETILLWSPWKYQAADSVRSEWPLWHAAKTKQFASVAHQKVGTIDANSACVEVGTISTKHLRRGVLLIITRTIITCEEKNRKLSSLNFELAQLEKEIELQTAKNEALSLNPAAKVEEKQFETNIENMIKSIKTLSLPVPTRSENFNLFFQSLERAFLTKKINDEYKSEILINLLGERAHNVLLYIKKEELNDYEKLKSIVLREFQLTPRECLNSFKNAVKSSGETYIQFAARLTANFQYYCSLRNVNSFESLCDLIISDKLFETLNKETATHIGIREAERLV